MHSLELGLSYQVAPEHYLSTRLVNVINVLSGIVTYFHYALPTEHHQECESQAYHTL